MHVVLQPRQFAKKPTVIRGHELVRSQFSQKTWQILVVRHLRSHRLSAVEGVPLLADGVDSVIHGNSLLVGRHCRPLRSLCRLEGALAEVQDRVVVGECRGSFVVELRESPLGVGETRLAAVPRHANLVECMVRPGKPLANFSCLAVHVLGGHLTQLLPGLAAELPGGVLEQPSPVTPGNRESRLVQGPVNPPGNLLGGRASAAESRHGCLEHERLESDRVPYRLSQKPAKITQAFHLSVFAGRIHNITRSPQARRTAPYGLGRCARVGSQNVAHGGPHSPGQPLWCFGPGGTQQAGCLRQRRERVEPHVGRERHLDGKPTHVAHIEAFFVGRDQSSLFADLAAGDDIRLVSDPQEVRRWQDREHFAEAAGVAGHQSVNRASCRPAAEILIQHAAHPANPTQGCAGKLPHHRLLLIGLQIRHGGTLASRYTSGPGRGAQAVLGQESGVWISHLFRPCCSVFWATTNHACRLDRNASPRPAFAVAVQ